MVNHTLKARLISILVFIIVISSQVSCSVVHKQADYRNSTLEYVKNQKSDELYELFSEELKNEKGFKDDLNLFLEKLYEYDLSFSKARLVDGGADKASEHGEYTYYFDSCSIKNIYDEDGNEYIIFFNYYIVNKENTKKEGLNFIQLSSITRNENYPQYIIELYVGIEGHEKDSLYTFYDASDGN